MALKFNFTTKLRYVTTNEFLCRISQIPNEKNETITFNNAYARIDSISGTKSKLVLTLNIYDETIENIIESCPYSFTPDESEDSERWDKQAYAYLKTLPEYIEAEDC